LPQEQESSHVFDQCLQFSTCWECSSLTFSKRAGGSKPTCCFVINSVSLALFNGNHHIICNAGFITIMCAFEFSAHTIGSAVRTTAPSRAHKRLAELVGRGERLKGGTASYLNRLCKKAWCDAMVISFGHEHEHRNQVRLRSAAMVHRARVL
jgi:hypothetical protein